MSTIAIMAPLFKRTYSGDVPTNTALRDQPFLSKITKPQTPFGEGDKHYYKVIYGMPQGMSANTANAVANASNTLAKQFEVTAKDYSAAVKWSRNLLLEGDQPISVVVNIKRKDTDGVLKAVGEMYSVYVWGDATGVLGRRASISTNTVTLTIAFQATQFEPGMTVIASPNADGSSPRTGSTTVTGVDWDAGTVTLASAAAIASFANNDYLFRQGDASAVITGIPLWIPLTVTSTTFNGVDRTAHAQRLAGHRISTAGSIKELTKALAAKMKLAGGKPDTLWLNPINWEILSNDLGTQVFRDQGGTATVGFDYIKFATAAGMLSVYADPHVPLTDGYILKTDTWSWPHRDKALINIVDQDGLILRKQSNTSNDFQMDFATSGDLKCDSPVDNGRFVIA